MKPARTALALGTIAFLLAGGAYAFPPRMHTERGTVKTVDVGRQTITLQVCCEEEQFVWRGWTRARVNAQPIAPQNITPGTPVRVSYRHEAGEQALYDVRSTKTHRLVSGACTTMIKAHEMP